MRRQVVALTLLAILVGCDSRTPTRPDPPPDPAAEVSALSISGDGRFTELNEVHRLSATAQLVSGASRDVTAAATWSSSDLAVASVSGHGEVTSRGVGLATIFAEYSRVSSFDVAVAPMDRSRIAGLYRLSFTAASACAALPDWARHREYNATLDQPAEPTESGALLVLTVQLPGGVVPHFEGLLKGSRVSFWFRTDDPYAPFGGGNPIFNDRIDDRRFFTVDGDAEGTMAASPDVRFAGTLQGTIRAMSLDAPDIECGNSRNSKNQFSLVHQ